MNSISSSRVCLRFSASRWANVSLFKSYKQNGEMLLKQDTKTFTLRGVYEDTKYGVTPARLYIQNIFSSHLYLGLKDRSNRKLYFSVSYCFSKTCVKRPLKKKKKQRS